MVKEAVIDFAYRVARRYRMWQRNYNLLDASYDVDLGPVRKKKKKTDSGIEMQKKAAEEPRSREFYVGERNNLTLASQTKKFCSNKIRTTKYSAISFIPKFLFEQFRKAANCFFLLVSFLQIIPGVSPTGRFTTLGPLTIILFLTALKEIYEDIRRWKQDKDLNEKRVRVLNKDNHGKFDWVVTNWDQLKVGNIVKISSTSASASEINSSNLSADIPADLLILATSERETGSCTITTKNLDGETNLKNKVALSHTHNVIMNGGGNGANDANEATGLTETKINNSFYDSVVTSEIRPDIPLGLMEASEARFTISCESPHKNMEVFKGQLKDSRSSTATSDRQAPPPSSESFDGRTGRSSTDESRFTEHTNTASSATRSASNGKSETSSTLTTLLDAKGLGDDDSAGQEVVVPLGIDNLLLRECRIENTEWVIGAVVYTGPEAKISLNSKKAPLKQSSLEKITNIQIYFILGIMLTLALVCFIGALVWADRNESETSYYIPDEDATAVVKNHHAQKALIYATFFILFNNLVPISLMYTVEMVKIIQAYFINSDPQMVYNLIGAKARTSNLNDELGRIKHIFSDKTGTLTQNKMEFKKCFINTTAFDIDSDLTRDYVEQNYTQRDSNTTAALLHEYLLMMAMCNSVTPNEKAHAGFISSSPDEHALVLGAKNLGYTLKSRGKDGCTVETPGGDLVEVREIHVVPFDSKRKRMSLIFEEISADGEKKYKIFTKGADATMLERLSESALNDFKTNSAYQINQYSKEGLRSLVFASRTVTKDEITNLDTILGKLSDPKTPPEEKLLMDRDYEDLVAQLESNMNLVGCSAVEDKLQDGVPECIYSLRAADINIWMLTGDKLETAYEIAHSCQLFSSNSDTFKVHKLESNPDDTAESVFSEMKLISHEITKYSETHKHGLIFEGAILKVLKFSPRNEEVCEKLYHFTSQFKSVAACRLEPLQKADLVEMTQKMAKGEITLAIGDGANDVPMIQAAHVGVGIQGEEGLQAVLASDYSISQFRFLKRLLLIHGAFSYQRVSKTILYSFYKNITLYLVNFWYQFVCGFSGQSVFDKITLALYNIVFTSLPLMSLGLLDRPVTEHKMLTHVYLYRTSQMSLKFNAKVFWTWCANGCAHSLFVFLMCLAATRGDTILPSGKATSVLAFGEVVYTAVMFVVTAKLILVTHTFYTLTILLIVIFGVIAWFSWMMMSSYVPTFSYTYGFFQNLIPTPYFWLTVILATLVALYRDVVYKCLKFQIYPSLEDCVKRGIPPRSTKRFKGLDGRINFSPIYDQSINETEGNRGTLHMANAEPTAGLKSRKISSPKRRLWEVAPAGNDSPPGVVSRGSANSEIATIDI